MNGVHVAYSDACVSCMLGCLDAATYLGISHADEPVLSAEARADDRSIQEAQEGNQDQHPLAFLHHPRNRPHRMGMAPNDRD